MSSRPIRIDGFEVDGLALRLHRRGRLRDFACPPSEAEAFARRLLAESEVEPIGLGARDTLRLEAGLCLYGHELDETIDPIEAGLSLVDPEAAARRGRFSRRGAHPGGARRRSGAQARRLAAAGRAPARDGAEIIDVAGAPIGRVTSGGFGPSVGAPIAMGYVGRAHAEIGTPVGLVVRGKPLAAPCRRPALPPPRLLPRLTAAHEAERDAHAISPRITNMSASTAAVATIGISDHAQQQLGDVVFVELPAVGAKFAKGAAAAVVESVKAASDVYSPGRAARSSPSTTRLQTEPSLINEDAQGRGWLFKLKLADPSELDALMDEAAYAEFLKTIA